MLFEHIVKNTQKVAIGPLEYCGNGKVVWGTHNEKRYLHFSWIKVSRFNGFSDFLDSVSVVRGDPRLGYHYAARELCGLSRIGLRVKTGKEKRKISKKSSKDLTKQLNTLKERRAAHLWKFSSHPPFSLSPVTPLSCPLSAGSPLLPVPTPMLPSSPPQPRLPFSQCSANCNKGGISPPLTKKKRLSEDKHLAIWGTDDLLDDNDRRRRKKVT